MIVKEQTFKLKRFGTSWGVIINKDLREMLGITGKDLENGCFIKTSNLEKVKHEAIENGQKKE